MVAIAMGLILGFTFIFLALMFTAVVVAAWPALGVLGLWLIVREHRLYRREQECLQDGW